MIDYQTILTLLGVIAQMCSIGAGESTRPLEVLRIQNGCQSALIGCVADNAERENKKSANPRTPGEVLLMKCIREKKIQ